MDIQAFGSQTDRDLARTVVRRGEERAFRELYCRHTPRLLGFIHRLLGRSGAESEDLAQETWIRACEKLSRFRWESSFSTWLLGIGLNLVRERQRRNARGKLESLDETLHAVATTGASAERIDLARAIELLPDGYRMALVLHDVEGMKHAEIAEYLGISSGTSKSQLFSARRAMRAMLTGSTEVRYD